MQRSGNVGFASPEKGSDISPHPSRQRRNHQPSRGWSSLPNGSRRPPASSRWWCLISVQALARLTWLGFVLLTVVSLVHHLILPRSTMESIVDNSSELMRLKRKSDGSGRSSLPLGNKGEPQKKHHRHRSRHQGSDESSRFHIVFSSGCSRYQEWQSELFFFSAMKSGQPGQVTRIVSGCDDEGNEQETILQQRFDQKIRPMAGPDDRFHLQFTPNFRYYSNDTKGRVVDYHFFNKPFVRLYTTDM